MSTRKASQSEPRRPLPQKAPSEPSNLAPVVNGIQLLSPRKVIPEQLQFIFPYPVFNAVQSRCFKAVYQTDDNVVVSAPTGSGKTALLELAISRLVNRPGRENSKIVYMAPTKALCKEKAEQWAKSFGTIGMQTSQLTGDTSRAEMQKVRAARIIVTTPEKWDSITRSWIDHRRLLDLVDLVLIDEVHFLKDTRGATLEVVVSRMKTNRTNVRLIALSATVPNSDDVAEWIGKNHEFPHVPAHLEVFGEEFRPVQLQKKVHTFDTRLADHAFDVYLNSHLWNCLTEVSPSKPTLVFCVSRKSCRAAAMTLADEWAKRTPKERLWPEPKERIPVTDGDLQTMVRCGVAFHHAGLDLQDRRAVEEAFLDGRLSVICCTSTLAVGVNLPCHTVVLKGTVGYQDGQLCEYSDIEVMQMLGRAGRPQFEDSACALILTRSKNRKRYETLVSGNEIVESTLNRNLIEHLNSEICLGTISDIGGAKKWMKGTFFYRRLLKNPPHYGNVIGGSSAANSLDPNSLDEKIQRICEIDIANLHDACLIKTEARYKSTEYGRAMSKYMIRFNTMKRILDLERGIQMKELVSYITLDFKPFQDLTHSSSTNFARPPRWRN